jgi:hypothetical protein
VTVVVEGVRLDDVPVTHDDRLAAAGTDGGLPVAVVHAAGVDVPQT